MILTLYVVLLLLAAVVVGLGVTLKEPYFTFVGLFFFFSLGILLMNDGVSIKNGIEFTPCDYDEYYVYGNNFTGYHWDYQTDPQPVCSNQDDFDCVRLFHTFRNYSHTDCVETTIDVYETVDSVFWYGFLLALASGFGMFALFWQLRNDFKKSKDIEMGEFEP